MSRKLWLLMVLLALPAASRAGSESMAKGTMFTVRIENVSTAATLKTMKGETAPAPNSPGVWVVHRGVGPLFTVGKTDLGWGMETQAEDGNPAALAEHCKGHEGVLSVGVFSTPKGDAEPGPALPGKVYEFTVTANPGDRLSFATMFGQSNDLFYAPAEAGIALFDGKGRAVSGDMTAKLELWDAGTEVNEEPGFGPNQAP
ncbi:MAG TPA: spondin domain-containing protein, partial [Candidatus Eisenbacteria bacterium]|nr:spondin domain-containing protein [Candidatus Eisenbacteria bacterium]